MPNVCLPNACLHRACLHAGGGRSRRGGRRGLSPQAGAHPGALAEILGAARQAFSFTSDGDQEWIFGKTAMALYPALAAR
jgi:hypothetical protein